MSHHHRHHQPLTPLRTSLQALLPDYFFLPNVFEWPALNTRNKLPQKKNYSPDPLVTETPAHEHTFFVKLYIKFE